MESHFKNIRERLIQELNKSEFIIHAAVAWISDFNIIKTLIDILKVGVKIELIVNDDSTFEKRIVQFRDFREHGGQLFLFKNDKALMHDKFCVIDLSTTITGSFNWSFNAATIHKENIIIERDNLEIAKNFAREFLDIKKSCVLFEGERKYYDLATYAEVTNIIGIGEGDELSLQLTIVSGNKFALEDFDYSFSFSGIPSPKKILGFWREKQRDYHGEDILANGRTLYNFEICDPLYEKYAFLRTR